jgi:hypothetical protein
VLELVTKVDEPLLLEELVFDEEPPEEVFDEEEVERDDELELDVDPADPAHVADTEPSVAW